VKAGALQETAELIDLGPTSLAALGVPSAIDRDGKVLKTLVGEGVDLKVEATESAIKQQQDLDTGLSEDEEGEIEDHLRGLGYVE
jgi:hypothetical protein